MKPGAVVFQRPWASMKVLELGAGPGLPGLAAAKMGARRGTKPPVTSPQKVVNSKGILPKMAETFRLRIHNELPRMMSITPPEVEGIAKSWMVGTGR